MSVLKLAVPAMIDFSFGVNWKLNDTVSILADYAFSHYNADKKVDASGYNASMIGLKTKIQWA